MIEPNQQEKCCDECREQVEFGYQRLVAGLDAFRCKNPSCPCHQEQEIKVEVKTREDREGCPVANGILICRCGNCKPEDYALPKDFPKPNLMQNPFKKQEECKQCILEGNHGVCDKENCLNFKDLPQNPANLVEKGWEEIIFLRYFCKTKYCIENVKSYYEPIYEPQKLGRHYYWANFEIPFKKIDYVQIGTWNRKSASKEAQRKAIIREAQIPELTDLHGLDLTGIKLKNKRQVLRNCVLPEIGKYILDHAINPIELQGSLL